MSLLISKSSNRLQIKQRNPLKDSVILSLNDYERIKNYSIFQTIDSIHNSNLILKEQHINHMLKADELKKKLINYDILNKINNPTRNLNKSSSVAMAFKKPKDNEDDCVKVMNQIILNAKVATIRDRQLEERKTLEQLYKDKERRLDFMMELERLKEIKFQKEKEIEIKRQQKEGSKIVFEQIKEADVERVRQRDIKEREKIQMLKQIEELETEEKRRVEQQKIHNLKLYKEAVLANKNSLLFKEMKKIEDKELNLKLLKYTIDKDKREGDLLMEKKRIQDAKEREVQKLREKQEKNLDKRLEYDILRAKRDYELNEKKTREQEAREIEKCKELRRELIEENNKQLKIKQVRKEEEAAKEKGYYDIIIEQQCKDNENEDRLKEEYKQKQYMNCEEVKKQIRNKEDKMLLNKKETIEQGLQIKQYNKDYNKYIEGMKEEKMNELFKLNVKPEYINDLRKFKIKKI